MVAATHWAAVAQGMRGLYILQLQPARRLSSKWQAAANEMLYSRCAALCWLIHCCA